MNFRLINRLPGRLAFRMDYLTETLLKGASSTFHHRRQERLFDAGHGGKSYFLLKKNCPYEIFMLMFIGK